MRNQKNSLRSWNVVKKLVYTVIFLSIYAFQSSSFRFNLASRSHLFGQRSRSEVIGPLYHGKSLAQEFMDSYYREKPILNPGSRISNLNMEPALQSEGPLASLELYATTPELQTFVASQISNWIRAERYTVLPYGSYSILFASLDGHRLVHSIGWKPTQSDASTEQTFNEFRKRASLAADGLPLDLKESTHIYKHSHAVPLGAVTSLAETSIDKYPLFSIDFYTMKLVENQITARNALKKALESVEGKIPDLISMHLLSSTDRLVHTVISTWSSLHAKEELKTIPGYVEGIDELKIYAVEGSISDMMEKSQPSRLYRVIDVYIP